MNTKAMSARQHEKGYVMWIAIGMYVLLFGTVSALRHYNFETQAWDLGVFVQSFWNTAQGRVMMNSLEQVPHHFGVHMSPWLLALVPGYIVFHSPYYLLIIQTLALAFGAWPLYLLARRLTESAGAARTIAVSYLLFPSLGWVNLYDFHEIAFFVPLFLAAFYFFEAGRNLLAFSFFFLAASTKEDAILMVLAAGAYLFIRRSAALSGVHHGGRPKFWHGARRNGAIITVSMAVYFLLAVTVVMPAFGGGIFRFDRYAHLGETPVELLGNLVKRPLLFFETVGTLSKLRYVFWLFVPVAFLPFFGGRAFLLIVPGLLENTLTNYAFQFSGLYHYDAVLIPGMFIAAAYGFRAVARRFPARAVLFRRILLGCAVAGFMLRSPLNPFSFPVELFRSNPEREVYRKLVALVPEGVSVAANTNLVPHLAHRERIYPLGKEPVPPDVLVIDGGDSFGFPDLAAFQAYVDRYAASGLYKAQIFEDRYLLLTKVAKAQQNDFDKTFEDNSRIKF